MKQGRRKKVLLASNILIYVAIFFGIFVMIKTYIDRRQLPDGMCPINNNQWLYYIAIALLLVSFIFNVIVTRKSKKQAKGKTEKKNTEK
jgi:H+/Cl- antiporter ClcA